MSENDYNSYAGQKISRIEAISDGVFAVAMTLLVLEIHSGIGEFHSETDLIGAFCRDLLPKFSTYLLGFMTLGIFWVGQSTQLRFTEKSDRNLTWISIFFLMFASVMPFSTAFLREYIDFKFAVGVYWLNIFLLGVVLYIQWIYAKRNKLVAKEFDTGEIDRAIRRRVITAQIAYALAALLCFINIYLSVAVTILIQINYAFAFFFNADRKKRSSSD